MQFLANENFPGAAVMALREAGHDVFWVRESSPGISDEMVLAAATRFGRLLITFDKDFGELAFRSFLPASSGVVLFRIRKQSAEYIAKRAVEILAGRQDWAGHFSVIEDDRIRMTPLPGTKE